MMDEWLRARECPGRADHEPPQQITATPTQLLSGLSVGLPTNRVVCVACGTQLQEGRHVTVYGYQTADRVQWDLRRCYCSDCAPVEVATPTLGVTELLARAWLGTIANAQTQTHELCLTDVEVVAYSPPAEGERA